MIVLNAPISLESSTDDLAAGVVRAFGRKLGNRASWSFIRTLLLSMVTFGVAPLLVWPAGLRDLIAEERAQFKHLAEWMRLRSGNPDAGRLVNAASQIRPSVILSRAPAWIAMGVAAIVLGTLWHMGWTSGQLLDATYHFGRAYPPLGPTVTNQLFIVWAGGLGIAYVLHWGQLLFHISHMKQAVREFNALAVAEGLPSVREPRGMGLRPIWLAAALLMLSANAIWAIPMMLGGGLQRRYVEAVGPRWRASIADRLRDLLSIRRPIIRLREAISLPRQCPNPRCLAGLQRIANFCPRCGTHVGPEVDELA